jgi:chromosome transmission fidelity protein 18
VTASSHKQRQQHTPLSLTPLHPSSPPEPPKRRGCWLDELKQRRAESKRPQPASARARGASPGAGGNGNDEAEAAKLASNARAGGPGSHVALFRFNEGYTNAVKRPLAIRELLQ